ncbi:HAT, C-terminal dimerization domain containing protein [Parasponia andersonii]|uniref:HAT, C-terminal dimerization domain containing protein n=1 Tax=Parasponia andersonii TaxID=3476 RepID=A0A2P5C8F5_PARAD|nr:HAT, C-terminal dimerization domain containing protein [Parasponia andersonii]
MNFVDFCYKKAYGENSLEIMLLRSKLQDLFNEYKDRSSYCAQVPPLCCKGASKNAQPNSMDIESELFKLELYLAEPKFARNTKFDVLAFWKSDQFCYLELLAMARDVLSIPASVTLFHTSRRCSSSGHRRNSPPPRNEALSLNEASAARTSHIGALDRRKMAKNAAVCFARRS